MDSIKAEQGLEIEPKAKGKIDLRDTLVDRTGAHDPIAWVIDGEVELWV